MRPQPSNGIGNSAFKRNFPVVAANVSRSLDAELLKQGFMRVDGTFEIPHE